MEKNVKFEKAPPEGLEKVLKQRVNEYFEKQQLSQRGDWRLYSKTIVLFAALITTFLIPLPENNYALWFCILFICRGLIIAGIGFNVMHDASHKSYSPHKSLNKVIAFLGGDAMGGSTFIWNVKHNVLHHTFTNIEGYDDDIAQSQLLRMHSEQELLPSHKYQHLYAPFLYMFLSLSWIINDFKRAFRTKKVLHKDLSMERRDKVVFLLGKTIYVIVFLIIPMVTAQVWWHGLLGFLIMNFALGLTLSLVFQMAHIVEETSFPVPPSMDEWMKHQLETTANFAMGNKLISWYVGGLNYQIEHHLFSNISHVHYPAISKIVQQTCKEFNIPYIEFPTFGKALKSHFRHLREMGQAA